MSAHLKAGVLKALLTMAALFSPPLLLAEPGIAAFPDGSPISVACWRCEPGLRAGICQQRYWGCCLRLGTVQPRLKFMLQKQPRSLPPGSVCPREQSPSCACFPCQEKGCRRWKGSKVRGSSLSTSCHLTLCLPHFPADPSV